VKSEEMSIARQRFGKHIPAEANERNNSKAIFSVVRAALVATQRCDKHISAAPKLYNEDLTEHRIESSSGVPSVLLSG
jgi:hypothetical protein